MQQFVLQRTLVLHAIFSLQLSYGMLIYGHIPTLAAHLVAKIHTEVILRDHSPASVTTYPMFLSQWLSGVRSWRGIISDVDWHGSMPSAV